MVPTSAAGAAFGAKAPMASATKSTAPAPSENPLMSDGAEEVAGRDREEQRKKRLGFEQRADDVHEVKRHAVTLQESMAARTVAADTVRR